MVWVGIRALIERAIVERTNFIVEGAHVVPGIVDPQFFKDAYILQMVLSVDDEKEHRSHFEIREVETEGMRPFARYLNNFDNIRKIQEYILQLASEQEVPVFPCYNIDQTIGMVLDFIINQVFVEYTNGKVEEGYMDKAMDAYAGRERTLSQMETVTEEGGKN